MSIKTKHLDLGCGQNPRNPYSQEELHGVDIREFESTKSVKFKKANLLLEKIPYEDSYFSSVSAFDFIEHVPRVLGDLNQINLPFISLMNEIWRVLVGGGRFYAVTPVFPHPAVFQDPTHVNIITKDTHNYFCGENPDAAIYGFSGRFEVIRAEHVIFSESLFAIKPTGFAEWRRYRREKRGRLSHFLWELSAVK